MLVYGTQHFNYYSEWRCQNKPLPSSGLPTRLFSIFHFKASHKILPWMTLSNQLFTLVHYISSLQANPMLLINCSIHVCARTFFMCRRCHRSNPHVCCCCCVYSKTGSHWEALADMELGTYIRMALNSQRYACL